MVTILYTNESFFSHEAEVQYYIHSFLHDYQHYDDAYFVQSNDASFHFHLRQTQIHSPGKERKKNKQTNKLQPNNFCPKYQCEHRHLYVNWSWNLCESARG